MNEVLKTLRQQLIQLRQERQQPSTRQPSSEQRLPSLILMALDKISTIYPRKIQTIAFYWPIHGEIDLRIPLTEWLELDFNRKLALPITRPKEILNFHWWDQHTVMQPGFANIPEPQDTPSVVADLIIAPCIGWQWHHQRLWRLGYGGGYYDRTMAAYSAQGIKPFLLGVAIDTAQIDTRNWQPMAHDHPLDALLTESDLYFSGSPEGTKT